MDRFVRVEGHFRLYRHLIAAIKCNENLVLEMVLPLRGQSILFLGTSRKNIWCCVWFNGRIVY